jgi:hypothetical protein
MLQQLSHHAQMLLSTYARWTHSGSDWSELEKLRPVSNRYLRIPATAKLLIGKRFDFHS